MNLILGDAEEFRIVRSKESDDREQKRTLRLVLVRGETVISLSVEGPPPKNESRTKTIHVPGPGVGRAAGRGVISAPAGLSRPGPGIGMPPPNFMQPPGGMGGFGMPPPNFGGPPGMMAGPPGMMAGPPGMTGPPPGMAGFQMPPNMGGPPMGGPPMMGRGMAMPPGFIGRGGPM